MAHRFQNIDRDTPLLLPADLRDWVAEDDLVHFIIQAVDRLPLSTFAVNHKGCGDEQHEVVDRVLAVWSRKRINSSVVSVVKSRSALLPRKFR